MKEKNKNERMQETVDMLDELLAKYENYQDDDDQETILDKTIEIRTKIRNSLQEIYDQYEPSLTMKSNEQFALKVKEFLPEIELDQVFTYFFKDKQQADDFGQNVVIKSNCYLNYKIFLVDEQRYALQVIGAYLDDSDDLSLEEMEAFIKELEETSPFLKDYTN
jgi:hypothetical protein